MSEVQTHKEVKPRSSRKQHILEAAATLFHEKGYGTTSMRDLALAVGLEPSSLYSHIRSKQELLNAICFDCAARFMEGIERIDSTENSPVAKLKALIDLHVEIATQDVTSTTVFNDEWKHLVEPALSEFLSMRKIYTDKCIALIEEGIGNNSIRDLNARWVLNTILSATEWVHRQSRHGRHESAEISSTISTVILHGLTSNTKI